MRALYDTIGIDYANLRRPDPRIAAIIHDALGDAASVVNIGAGAGSYEPTDRAVTAVEPSREMIRQRPAGSALVVQASAEALPFPDHSFDAAMAVLTLHHWQDCTAGLREMRRVARGPAVILTFDPEASDFWLFDYLPEIRELDRAQMPKPEAFHAALGPVEQRPVPIPWDCRDGFLCAYWRRPAAYLDPAIRRSMSPFWQIADPAPALSRLERDLRSGAWERRYGHVLEREVCDVGYRLVTSL